MAGQQAQDDDQAPGQGGAGILKHGPHAGVDSGDRLGATLVKEGDGKGGDDMDSGGEKCPQEA